MSKCAKCDAPITWAIRLKTLAKIPLVDLDPSVPNAPRFAITGKRANGDVECERSDTGDKISHFSNCPHAGSFSKKGAR